MRRRRHGRVGRLTSHLWSDRLSLSLCRRSPRPARAAAELVGAALLLRTASHLVSLLLWTSSARLASDSPGSRTRALRALRTAAEGHL